MRIEKNRQLKNKGDIMNKIELLNESRILSLALVLMGIVLGLSVFSTGTADPWVPWPWV